jgi:hypothetical protein
MERFKRISVTLPAANDRVDDDKWVDDAIHSALKTWILGASLKSYRILNYDCTFIASVPEVPSLGRVIISIGIAYDSFLPA